MYTEVLRSMQGIGIFPAISLVVFVVFFSAMLFWVWHLRSDRLAEYSQMPLDPLGNGGPAASHRTPTEGTRS